MNLIDKLRAQDSFTDAESVLANYILDNLTEISRLTIYELSENSFCSVATISRFCKKLKIKNFSALKVELAKESSTAENVAERIQHNHPFSKDDSEKEIAKKLRTLSVQTLNDTYASLDYVALHKAAVMLDKAEIIDIYANWKSYVNAMDLHSKLLWMGKNSNIESTRGYQLVKAKISNERHMAVLISYYGTNDRNILIAKWLHDNHTPYILITGPKKNPLCLYADVVIHLPSEEEYRDKIASFSSDVAMQYAVNILYSYLFALNYEENLKSRYSSVSKDGKIELN
ncbi:MAG: MurR/RpiR family transcriptional regulator [Erysipelotrichaceae bacterium]|nr:MurR/RpiR family transcriptional regulator [Erysipelotrichaceae bacterium]